VSRVPRAPFAKSSQPPAVKFAPVGNVTAATIEHLPRLHRSRRRLNVRGVYLCLEDLIMKLIILLVVAVCGVR
jgi:hypothetical protein